MKKYKLENVFAHPYTFIAVYVRVKIFGIIPCWGRIGELANDVSEAKKIIKEYEKRLLLKDTPPVYLDENHKEIQ